VHTAQRTCSVRTLTAAVLAHTTRGVHTQASETAVFITDGQHRVVYANAALGRLVRCPPAAVIGKDCCTLLPLPLADAERLAAAYACADTAAVSLQLRFTAPSNSSSSRSGSSGSSLNSSSSSSSSSDGLTSSRSSSKLHAADDCTATAGVDSNSPSVSPGSSPVRSAAVNGGSSSSRSRTARGSSSTTSSTTSSNSSTSSSDAAAATVANGSSDAPQEGVLLVEVSPSPAPAHLGKGFHITVLRDVTALRLAAAAAAEAESAALANSFKTEAVQVRVRLMYQSTEASVVHSVTISVLCHCTAASMSLCMSMHIRGTQYSSGCADAMTTTVSSSDTVSIRHAMCVLMLTLLYTLLHGLHRRSPTSCARHCRASWASSQRCCTS
jgi:PAS fold